MTRDEVVDTLMRRFHNRTESSNTVRDAIIAEILLAIPNSLEAQPELPWFLLEEVPFTTTAAQDSASLDAEFLAVWEEGGFYLQNDDGTETELSVDDWSWIKKNYVSYVGSSENASPQYLAVIGSTAYMKPTPDDVYTINYWQFKKDDISGLSGSYGDANAANTSLWLTYAPEWVMGEVGAIVASTMLNDQASAQNFVALANRAKDKIMARTVYELEKLKQRYMEG